MYMTCDLQYINQSNTTNLNISFSMEKELLRWELNPRHAAHKADALPTEVPKQLSWLGQIKAIQGKGNQV